MSYNSKSAISLAIVLAMTSSGIAATKRQTVGSHSAYRNAPAAAFGSYAYAPGERLPPPRSSWWLGREPTSFYIQDRSWGY